MKDENRNSVSRGGGRKGGRGGESWCEEERGRKEEKEWDKITGSSEMIQSSPWETPLFTNSWAAYPAATPPPNITYTNALPMCVCVYIYSYPPITSPNPQHKHRMRKWPPFPSNKKRAYGMDWMCKLKKKNEAGERYTSNLPFSVLVEFFDFGYNSPPFPSSFTYSILWELELRGEDDSHVLLRLYPWSNRSIAHCILPILLLIGLSIQKLFFTSSRFFSSNFTN